MSSFPLDNGFRSSFAAFPHYLARNAPYATIFRFPLGDEANLSHSHDLRNAFIVWPNFTSVTLEPLENVAAPMC